MRDFRLAHPNPNDEPNVGRRHGWHFVPVCGLCRCGAHNPENNPADCPDCLDTITNAARLAVAPTASE